MRYRLGRLPQTLTKKLFGKSFFELQKLLLKQSDVFGRKFLRIFKVLFTKSSLKRRFGTAVPTYFDKLKSTALPCFLCALSVGASAPNPDTKDFSGKVLWNLKSFAKLNWCFLSGVLWLIFLIRKVCLLLSVRL